MSATDTTPASPALANAALAVPPSPSPPHPLRPPPAHAPRRGLLELPNELLLCIVDALRQPAYFQEVTRNDPLESLALTSRRLYALTRPLRLSRLSLFGGEILAEVLEAARREGGRGGLAVATRSLCVCAWDDRDRAGVLLTALQDYLPRLERLQLEGFGDWFAGVMEPENALRLFDVRRLVLDDTEPPLVPDADFPGLLYLELKSICQYAAEDFVTAQRPPQLRALSLCLLRDRATRTRTVPFLKLHDFSSPPLVHLPVARSSLVATQWHDPTTQTVLLWDITRTALAEEGPVPPMRFARIRLTGELLYVRRNPDNDRLKRLLERCTTTILPRDELGPSRGRLADFSGRARNKVWQCDGRRLGWRKETECLPNGFREEEQLSDA